LNDFSTTPEQFMLKQAKFVEKSGIQVSWKLKAISGLLFGVAGAYQKNDHLNVEILCLTGRTYSKPALK